MGILFPEEGEMNKRIVNLVSVYFNLFTVRQPVLNFVNHFDIVIFNGEHLFYLI